MAKGRKAKKSYSERTDAEKIRSNWNKTIGLFEGGEYSVSIIRAATTVELATNLVIRAELVRKRKLPSDFVDHLMVWANGLIGKLNKIIFPILKGIPRHKTFKKLEKEIQQVNTERNGVVHRGEFKTREIARATIEPAHRVILGLVRPYEKKFKIKKL